MTGPNRDARDPDVLSSLLQSGYLVVGGEDSIHLYDDHWTDPPIHLVRVDALGSKYVLARAAQYYRLFYRRIANVVDLRSMKAALVPPGWVASSPFANRTPMLLPTSTQLTLLAIMNSFVFDWSLRMRLTNTLNLFIVESLPIPAVVGRDAFLSHQALRLSCNHAGYAALWADQLGTAWREAGHPLAFPVLPTGDERWQVRAAMDAVLADAYGLDQRDYRHVLSSFSHRTFPAAAEACVAAFDELQTIGLEAFVKKHDAYLAHGASLLTKSLHPDAYKNNPSFVAFIERTALPFAPVDVFDPDAQRERQELYLRIAEWVWNPSRLDLDGEKPPVPEPLHEPEDEEDEAAEPVEHGYRHAMRLKFWTALQAHEQKIGGLHADQKPGAYTPLVSGLPRT